MTAMREVLERGKKKGKEKLIKGKINHRRGYFYVDVIIYLEVNLI